MPNEENSAISNSLSDLGVGATITAVVSWLWSVGWWHWVPGVLVACLGVYTLVFERRLPWHGTVYADLRQLGEGKGNHPVLQKAIRGALESISWSEQVNVGGDASQDTPQGVGRWLKTMSYANHRLDRWMGQAIWSYSVFDRLLLFAVLYPILCLLIFWWWTGVSRLGSTAVLPSLGSGNAAFGWRSLVIGLTLWPWAALSLSRRWPGSPINVIAIWKVWMLLLAPVFTAFFVPLLWGFQEVASAVLVVFASTGTLVFAVALTGGTLRGGAGAFAGGTLRGGAGAFAVAAGFAVAFGDAFAGESVVLGSFGFMVACLVELTAAFLIVKKGKQAPKFKTALANASTRAILVLVIVPILGAVLLLGTTALRWLPSVGIEIAEPVPRNTMWLFVLGWLPVINAIFDWLSLGITRELLRRMTRSPIWMWAGVLLDVLTGVLLTLTLFWLAFQVLALMQWSGWPVDAKAMRAAFIATPFDPQISWMAMLAVTNLVPTIWHLGVSLWGLVDRQFTTSVSLKNSLMKLNAFMDEKGSPKPGVPAPSLGELELQTIYHSLYVHPWLYTGTVVALVVGLWGGFVQALRWTLTWLP